MHSVPWPFPCPVSLGTLSHSSAGPHFSWSFCCSCTYRSPSSCLWHPWTDSITIALWLSELYLCVLLGDCLCIPPRLPVPASNLYILNFYVWVLPFTGHPRTCCDGLLLILEEAILEHQSAFLDIFSLQGLTPWESFKQIFEYSF